MHSRGYLQINSRGYLQIHSRGYLRIHSRGYLQIYFRIYLQIHGRIFTDTGYRKKPLSRSALVSSDTSNLIAKKALTYTRFFTDS